MSSGITTFSASSLDAALLVERTGWLLAILCVAGSVGLSLPGFFAALRLTRVILT